MEKMIFGKETRTIELSTWKGNMIEVRQNDSLNGEQIVMLDEEIILALAEKIKGNRK